MKTDRITKLYNSLNSQELAAMAFRHLIAGNTIEFERLSSAVPWASYRCPDIEFRLWLDGFMHMASLWSIEYWRLQCRRTAALSGMALAKADNQDDFRRVFSLALNLWESRLLALDEALDFLCEEYGIDPESVRKHEEANRFKPSQEGCEPDSDFRDAVLSGLRNALKGWQNA